MQSEDWKNLRAAVVSHPIWKGKCWICQRKRKCDAHHLRYRNLYDVKVSDIVPLCRTCHEKIHKILRETGKKSGVLTSLFHGHLGRFRYFQFRLWNILCRVREPKQTLAIMKLVKFYPEFKKLLDNRLGSFNLFIATEPAAPKGKMVV